MAHQPPEWNVCRAGRLSCDDGHLLSRPSANPHPCWYESAWRSQKNRSVRPATPGRFLSPAHHAGRLLRQPRPVQGFESDRRNSSSRQGEQPLSSNLRRIVGGGDSRRHFRGRNWQRIHELPAPPCPPTTRFEPCELLDADSVPFPKHPANREDLRA